MARTNSFTIRDFAAHQFFAFVANTGENVCDAFLTDPLRKTLLQIQGLFNQLEKDRLVVKVRKAREAKRKKTG